MFNRMKYGVIVAVTALVIVCGIIYFSLSSRSDSPDYALEMVEDSIKTHDTNKFNKVVDIDQVLESSYEGFVDGLINFDKTLPSDVKESIMKFSQALKMPMMTSMKVAIENYVEHGNFDSQSTDNNSNNNQSLIAATEILDQSGLKQIEFRDIDNVLINKDNEKSAIAEVRVYQQEAEREFVFEVELNRTANNQWQVVSVRNFRDFVSLVNQSRRESLDKYLETTAEIISKHDKTIRESEQKYGSILSIGSLSKDNTRDDLKNLMNDVKKDWENRKQELFNVSVPKGAETLQNLRIKICDLSIESADLYVTWFTDKKAQTIKEAEDRRKQVQALSEEEKLLLKRMQLNNK